MQEIWKPISGYEKYQVSNLGRVIGSSGKMLKQWIGTTGYWEIALCKNAVKKTQSVHVLVAQAFVPGLQVGYEVDHLDGNRLNACASNLEWCDRRTNIVRCMRRKSGLKSPYPGVYYRPSRGHYRVMVCSGGKQRYIGSRQTPEAAYILYKETVKQLS
jgi:hypothetical protein